MPIIVKVMSRPFHFHHKVPGSKSAPLNSVSQQILSACYSFGMSQNGSLCLNSILGTSGSEHSPTLSGRAWKNFFSNIYTLSLYLSLSVGSPHPRNSFLLGSGR